MTPLQTAAQAVIARWESPKWKDEAPTAVVIGALLKALTDEQAQAAEPVGYLNLASVKLPGEKHPACEFSYERNNNAAAAIPLYIHPAPSPAKAQQVAEQAQSVEPESQWPTKAAIDALKRFEETCSDGEGYDVPKDAMRALQAVGLVYRTRGNVYATTDFGNRVLAGRFFNQPAPPVEQAQGVEPVATVQCINGVTIGYLDVMQPVGTKLYTHPAPPPAGERAELIADLRLNHEYCPKEVILEAADMLEADAQELEATERQVEILSDDLSKCSKAQQVAVPMTEAQIFECDPVPHVMFDQQRIDFARAIEAFHGIGAKP